MTKYIFKIQILCLALLVLSGCNDFLDKEVLGNSTDKNFYDTRYKLQAALNATYDILQSDEFTIPPIHTSKNVGTSTIKASTALIRSLPMSTECSSQTTITANTVKYVRF